MKLEESFAINVKYYRTLNGMTQRELASAVDVSPATVASWENAKFCSIKVLINLAQVLNVTETDLLHPNKNIEFPNFLTKRFSYGKRKDRLTQKVTKTVMNEIERRRLLLGMTQGEFAERIGVTSMTINRWERGEKVANKKMLPKIAEVLGCTEAELLSPSPDAEQPQLKKIRRVWRKEKS